MSRFELPPVQSGFDSQCRDARRLAESYGLLSLEFALCDASLSQVKVINRKSGIARQYPRTHWLDALRKELDAGALGCTKRVAASMKQRLERARTRDVGE